MRDTSDLSGDVIERVGRMKPVARNTQERGRTLRMFRIMTRTWRKSWQLLARNRYAIAIASLIWLVWRSGTKPQRLGYPCQQAAAANVGALAVLLVPALARRVRKDNHVRCPAFVRSLEAPVALAGVLAVLIGGGVTVWSEYIEGGPAGTPALQSWSPADVTAPAALSPRLLEPDGQEAIVALERNNGVAYGTQPYGPGANTAYELVWQTVVALHLGSPDNPLADYVQDMDGDGVIRVHIKPNHVEAVPDVNGARSPAYTHPAIFRPLVDMLALAGAEDITIGDACAIAGNNYLATVADPNGLTSTYVSQLQSGANALPGVGHTVTVTRVDLNNYNSWCWVDLGADPGEAGASSYYGSGYDDSDLVKSTQDATYFTRTDIRGQAGPGRTNSMGWLAIPNRLLQADVVIDTAKLKVHYYGVTTAILKNWVGATMLSTYSTSNWLGWCRVSHEKVNPTDYDRGFGNDILWRELVDAHRSILYWRDGVVHDTPQRRVLYVLDAINCAEDDHLPGTPWPVWLNTMVAGVSPVAVDAVGARLQRYDFRRVPIINNAHASSIGSAWTLGTGDPGQVRIVGDTMVDDSYSHIFIPDDRYDPSRTWPDWNAMMLNDITPPVINTATATDMGGGAWQIDANISNGHVAFYYYGNDGNGAPLAARLGRSGDSYSAVINGPAGNGVLVAQDLNFNTARSEVISAAQLEVDPLLLEKVAVFGWGVEDDSLTVRNSGIGTMGFSASWDVPWLNVNPTEGVSTGPDDPFVMSVSYDTTGLDMGTYQGAIEIQSPDAINSPVTVQVLLHVVPLIVDVDADGDVDQSDFGECQCCLDATGTPRLPECTGCDFDDSGYVDQTDLNMLRACMAGAENIPEEGCLDQAPQ